MEPLDPGWNYQPPPPPLCLRHYKVVTSLSLLRQPSLQLSFPQPSYHFDKDAITLLHINYVAGVLSILWIMDRMWGHVLPQLNANNVNRFEGCYWGRGKWRVVSISPQIHNDRRYHGRLANSVVNVKGFRSIGSWGHHSISENFLSRRMFKVLLLRNSCRSNNFLKKD